MSWRKSSFSVLFFDLNTRIFFTSLTEFLALTLPRNHCLLTLPSLSILASLSRTEDLTEFELRNMVVDIRNWADHACFCRWRGGTGEGGNLISKWDGPIASFHILSYQYLDSLSLTSM